MHKIKNNPTNKDDAVNKKYVDDNIINKLDNTIILNNADEVNSFNKGYQSFIVEPSVADEIGLPNSPSSTWFCIHYSHSKGFEFPSQVAFEYAGLERIMYRTCGNGVWHNWRKVGTTSVADVSKTDITFIDSNVSKDGSYEICQYCVLNGICYVTLNGLTFNSSYVSQTPFANLPRPVFRQDFALTNSYGDISLGKLFLEPNGTIHLYTMVTPVPDAGFISFSYPVAES